MKLQLVLVALLGVASAHKAAVTNQLCSTLLGLKSVKNVKTSTKTVNINLTAYKKVCPTVVKTFTPKPKTTTRTNTVTSTIISTLPKGTDTVTVTSTGRFSVLASSLHVLMSSRHVHKHSIGVDDNHKHSLLYRLRHRDTYLDHPYVRGLHPRCLRCYIRSKEARHDWSFCCREAWQNHRQVSAANHLWQGQAAQLPPCCLPSVCGLSQGRQDHHYQDCHSQVLHTQAYKDYLPSTQDFY